MQVRTVAGAAALLTLLMLHGSSPVSAADLPALPRRSCDLQVSTAAAEGVDARALQELVDSARATRSDAFVVLKNGRVIAEWYSPAGPRPIQTMSATKSIVGLAIGRLIQDRQLDSLDQPVSTLFPEWKQGRKRAITLRHLLDHTSGMQDLPGDGPEIAPAPDAVQLSLSAELSADPGATWSYSNKAVNLLSGVVARAAKKPLDRYVREDLLRPLCITDAEWQFRDSVGTPYGMAGLMLHARDLAKVGQMMLDDGQWNGTAVLSPDWVRASVAPSQQLEPRYGLLWWIEPAWSASTIDSSLVATWRAAGVDPELVGKLAPLVGRRFVGTQWRATVDSALGAAPQSAAGLQRLAAATRARGVPMRRVLTGPSRGFYANGSLGQWLFVAPAERLVIVRQIARRADHRGTDTFEGLPALALRLLAK